MHLSEFDLFRNTWPFLTSSIASDLWRIFRLTTFSQRRGLRRAWRDHSQPYLRGFLRWISRYIFQQELLMHCLQGHCLHAHSLTDWRSWHRDYSFIKLWNGNNQNLTRFCSVSIWISVWTFCLKCMASDNGSSVFMSEQTCSKFQTKKRWIVNRIQEGSGISTRHCWSIIQIRSRIIPRYLVYAFKSSFEHSRVQLDTITVLRKQLML